MDRVSYILNTIGNQVTKWVARVLACLIGGMTATVIMAIISRFVIKIPIPWTEEVSRYLMVWTAFIAGSLGLKRGVHVGIVFVVERAPRNTRRWISLITKLSVLFFFAVVIVEGFYMSMFVSTQLSPVLRISMAWVYSSLPVGGILFSFYTVQSIVEDLKHFLTR